MTTLTEFALAEIGIRQLHARYTDAVWRQDFEAFGNCFAEDAEWRITGFVLKGRPAILQSIKQRLPHAERVMMTFRTPLLTVHGDGTASARTYVTEINAFKNGRPGCTAAIYWERFVQQGDVWRFKWRMFQLHYIGDAEYQGPYIPNAEYGPPPNMPPLDAVPPHFDETAWPPKKAATKKAAGKKAKSKAKKAPVKKVVAKKKVAKKKAKKK
jgi:ketosteroid isomerase-like protein